MDSLRDIKMSGTNLSAEMFLLSIEPEERQIVTDAMLECLKRGWPLNRTAIGHLAREMRRNLSANNS